MLWRSVYPATADPADIPLYLGHGQGAGPVQGRPRPAHLGAQGGRGHSGHHQVHRGGGVMSAMSTSVGVGVASIRKLWLTGL